MSNKNNKNPVCAIWWNDASYSFLKNKPQKPPLPILTVGFIIETNDEFTNIATDVKYNKKTEELEPSRGVLIPEKSIIKFKKISFLNE
ncbi:MAG: hypothetical protein WD607_01960 [Candidatus Paceibacterota bacterium]